MIKNCVECGKEFEARHKINVCSNVCRKNRINNRGKHANLLASQARKCKRCGTTGLKPRTQFCSAKCKTEQKDALEAKRMQSLVVNCEHCGKERLRSNVAKSKCMCQRPKAKTVICSCIQCGKQVNRKPCRLRNRPNVLCSVKCSDDWHRGAGRKYQWKIGLNTLWASIRVCSNCNLAFKKTKNRNNNICHACDRLLSKLLVSIRQSERRQEELKQREQKALTRCIICGECTKGSSGVGRNKKYCSKACYKKSDVWMKNKRVTRQRRNARKRMAHVESVDPIIVFKRDNWRCAYCKCKVIRSNGGYEHRAATMDHVVPISKGGPHTYENIVTACQQCNNKKSNKIETLF